LRTAFWRTWFHFNDAKLKKIRSDFRADLRGWGVDLRNDKKTGRPYISVIFNEGAKPDTAALPKRVGFFPVRHEFRPPYPTFGTLMAIFEKHKGAVHAAQAEFGGELIGVGMDCDEETAEPHFRFTFENGSKPDFGKLPPMIGGIKVVHEFRDMPGM